MQRSLPIKALVTSGLALALILPLGAILSVVRERHAASQSVLVEIQQTGVGAQTLVGPILVVPYRKTVVAEVVDSQTKQRSLATTAEDGRLHFLPETLSVSARVSTEKRMRGIYSALLYDAQQAITGSFVVPDGFGVLDVAGTTYAWGDAYVLLGVGDTRGIKGTPLLHWAGASRSWTGGTEGSTIGDGIHASVGRLAPSAHEYSFGIDLSLQGTQSIEFVPVGKQTTVEMRSEWPHPSFVGQFLPESRAITDRGFEAVWRTSHLASNVEVALAERLHDKRDSIPNVLGVAFIQPVDVYQQSERAIKYGFLFIIFTFVLFQLFELLRKLAIHPVQYGLVGVALAMFFLMLLALTEHVPFVIAYCVASASCVGLLAFYVSFVLRSARRSAGFTALLSLLYGALYVLLRSEDMALLLGAILLFGILAAIMVVTRHVDWYRIAAPERAGSEAH